MTAPRPNPTLSTTWEVERPDTIFLTENQRKVIEDKYLKDAPTIEAWLRGVAHNIALAELLYHPSMPQWGLFNGVRVFQKELANPAYEKDVSREFLKVFLLHHNIPSATDRDNNLKRFLENAESIIKRHPEAAELVRDWENRFYQLMSSWSFLPNSPTLMNAGRDLQQLSACYVLPVEDSMEGITSALQAQALIHKSGGGTGFSFGRLRPKGDSVQSTQGIASGVISFIQVFDKMTAVVKQGGNRRGANMGVLPYHHPEIRSFIQLKDRPGSMENFNISVAIDEKFWEAYENNWEYDLLNPRSHQVEGRASAHEIFTQICESAWKSGDPGILFIDRINNSNSNPTPGLGQIESTNPCGEQPLLPNEPCNLGSINLSLFVQGELGKGTVDWTGLKSTVQASIRLLDNAIDVNNYPLAEVERMAKSNRRIGLGVMGWSEMLVKMGLPYDSVEAVEHARKLMEFINKAAMEASEKLAQERGVFPNWAGSIYDPQSAVSRGQKHTPRNCARTTIAPTGTIGLAAGLQGAGIEPFYAIAYTRYNAAALEAVKAGRAPKAEDVYFEVNPLFRKMAEKNNFFGLSERELWKRIEGNNKSIRGLREIPAEIQALFATAHDVSPEFHVRMQAAFQAHTDNAVSKTVNLPHTATVNDVRKVYLLAHELGCKGVTIYRDGSKRQQVLNLSTETRRPKTRRDLSLGVSSEYYEIKTGHGPLHVHIDYDEEGPQRLFASLSPVGTELAGLASVLGVVISKYLEQGGSAHALVKHLQSVKGDRPFGLGEARVNSISHALGIALSTHLKKHNIPETENNAIVELEDPTTLELWNLTNQDEQCPECFSSNVKHGAGCSGPVCNDCGYSACN